jgi:hypothetical protein
MNNSNYLEYLKVFTYMMQEIVRSTPPSWKEGVITIRRNGQNFECEVINPDTSEHLEISEKVRSLCREYACFKSSPDWKSDWSEAIFPYILGENPGDFSSTDGTHKYPEEQN